MSTLIRENPLFQIDGKTMYYCGDAIRFADFATFVSLGNTATAKMPPAFIFATKPSPMQMPRALNHCLSG